MAMENTRARAERLAQHILVYGRPVPPEEIVARIDAVDADALARVAARTFASMPTLAAIGRVGSFASLPPVGDVLAAAE